MLVQLSVYCSLTSTPVDTRECHSFAFDCHWIPSKSHLFLSDVLKCIGVVLDSLLNACSKTDIAYTRVHEIERLSFSHFLDSGQIFIVNSYVIQSFTFRTVQDSAERKTRFNELKDYFSAI